MDLNEIELGLPWAVPALCAVKFDGSSYSEESAAPLGVIVPATLAGAVPRRKAAFVAGRYCAQRALVKILGWAPSEIPIGEARAPVWPAATVGSITHTEGFAAAVVARESAIASVGVDAEQIMSPETCTRIAHQIVRHDEWKCLPDKPDEDDWSEELFVSAVFSAKECIFKCLYRFVGEYFDFLDAALVALDPVAGRLRFRILRDLSPSVPRGFELEGRFARTSPGIFTYFELTHRPG